MAFKFIVFVAFVAVGFAWPYDRQFYDQPEGGYGRPHGGYGRPSYGGGNDESNYNQHGYGRSNGGYGRPHGGYGRPSNVGDNNWGQQQEGGPSQGSQWQGSSQGEEFQQPQQPHQSGGGAPIPSSPFGGRFDGSSAGEAQPPNPSTFGERLGGPTTGNNFSPQVNVEPTNKIAEGVKTFGGTGTPPPVSPNAPLDPNIDLTGSRVFHNGGGDSESAPSSADATPQNPSESSSDGSEGSSTSTNGEDLTGLPSADSQQPSQGPVSTSESETENQNTSPSSGSAPLFGGAPVGAGTDGDSSSPPSGSESGNEPPVTINPSETADSGLVLG
uniref:Uncharacterized protein n=1 Tax=Panagrolaimus superbus TaxID=310955 RepID=A0A914Y3R3_9BILA